MRNILSRITLLAILSCVLFGCQSATIIQNSTQNTTHNTVSNSTTTHPTEPKLLYGISYDIIYAQHDTFGKFHCTATITEDFTENEVIITVYPFANDIAYTAADFAEIGCTQVEELMNTHKPDQLSRILLLTLDCTEMQGVLDAIAMLEQRDDVYSAEPNGLGTAAE